MFRKHLLACSACLFVTAPALAENQIWSTINLKAPSPDGARFEFELNNELRFQPDGDLDTVEIRPGLSYALGDHLKLSGGYLYAVQRRSGPDSEEHRLWQQVSYAIAKAGSGTFNGRTRIEQRWRVGADRTGWRARQQFAFEHPIGSTGLNLNISDELTFGLNKTDWGHQEGFQENRAKAVVKWKTGETDWELGYMNQHRNGIGGAEDEDNHHIVIGVSAGF